VQQWLVRQWPGRQASQSACQGRAGSQAGQGGVGVAPRHNRQVAGCCMLMPEGRQVQELHLAGGVAGTKPPSSCSATCMGAGSSGSAAHSAAGWQPSWCQSTNTQPARKWGVGAGPAASQREASIPRRSWGASWWGATAGDEAASHPRRVLVQAPAAALLTCPSSSPISCLAHLLPPQHCCSGCLLVLPTSPLACWLPAMLHCQARASTQVQPCRSS